MGSGQGKTAIVCDTIGYTPENLTISPMPWRLCLTLLGMVGCSALQGSNTKPGTSSKVISLVFYFVIFGCYPLEDSSFLRRERNLREWIWMGGSREELGGAEGRGTVIRICYMGKITNFP